MAEDRSPLLERAGENRPLEFHQKYGSGEELKYAIQWTRTDSGTAPQARTPSGEVSEAQSTGEALAVREPRRVADKFVPQLRRYLADSHWPLSVLMALVILGFYLPQKQRSRWPLTVLPFVVLLLGLGTHGYFILSSPHGSVFVGTKMLLTSLWVSSCVTYGLGLHHLRGQAQDWVNELSVAQWRLLNALLYLGLSIVSLVLFCDARYQVIFDLVHIKDALLRDCTSIYCEPAFYLVAVSVYWGMCAAVTICCVFFGQCLSMCNALTRGYKAISRCTKDLPETLRMHAELRGDVAERIRGMRMWFCVHLVFNIVILLGNIFVWWEASSSFTTQYEYLAQVAGTLVVAYKFFFPFIAASYVTWHEFGLAQQLNDRIDYASNETFSSRIDLEVFLSQSKRRGYGFRLYKVKITFTIAIFSLLGSVFGLIYNMMRKY